MEHVMSFLNTELGVACSLDPEGRLTFKGTFKPKQIESIVRKYMLAYVQCQMCKVRHISTLKAPNTQP